VRFICNVIPLYLCVFGSLSSWASSALTIQFQRTL
jgi:hypothetical protein